MTRLQRLIKVKESAASYMTSEETAVVTDKYALKCLQSLLPRVRLLIQNSLESTQEIYRQAHTRGLQRDIVVGKTATHGSVVCFLLCIILEKFSGVNPSMTTAP